MKKSLVILLATRIFISYPREQIFFKSSDYEDGKSNNRNPPRVKTIWFEPKYDDSSDISDRRIETSRYSESPDRNSRSSSVDSFRKSTYSESPEKRIRRFESSSSSRSSESPRGNSNRQARYSFGFDGGNGDKTNENEIALDTYREGWTRGDPDLILSVVDKDSFNFTWLPDNDDISPERFPEFINDFISASEEISRKNYYMKTDNIIRRKVGDIIYEAGDWIVDGFDRGTFMAAASRGQVMWDIVNN